MILCTLWMKDILKIIGANNSYVEGYFLASPYGNKSMEGLTYVSSSWGLTYGSGENTAKGGYECFRN